MEGKFIHSFIFLLWQKLNGFFYHLNLLRFSNMLQIDETALQNIAQKEVFLLNVEKKLLWNI